MPKKSKAKKLVIVESPTKARTLSGILGSGYQIMASMGHIRDLPKSGLGVDTEGDFSPKYVIPTKARKTVTALKKAAAESDELFLATDEDREGEAIAWHILQVIDDQQNVKRIAFHEITERAIKDALEHPRDLDVNLVDAQQGRRVLDRLVGYKLSPLLWKKIVRGLSAGRVQSAALRLLVEREREVLNFKPEEYWQIAGKFSINQDLVVAELDSAKGFELPIRSEELAKKLEAEARAVKEYKVTDLTVEEKTYASMAPFTTSTLQQAANTKLGFSVKKTMTIAQQLYEGIKLGGKSQGLITYMRTDSTHLAPEALTQIRGYIENAIGKEYLPEKPKVYTKKSKNAQEAHEAIRPSNVTSVPEEITQYLTPDQFKLYRLIWQRAVASQMEDMRVQVSKLYIEGGGLRFKAIANKTLFLGFAKIWPKQVTEQEAPKVADGDSAILKELPMEQKFTEPPARFNEATLVKQLEKLGIGRPSTYSPTITTLQTRGYVKKDGRQLIPQEIGMMVNDFLVEHFPDIVDYKFTAEMEDQLDDVAEGKREWRKIIKDFYEPFIKQINMKDETLNKVEAKDTVDEKCPKCGGELTVKFGKFGKFVACSKFPECRYTGTLNDNGTGLAENEPSAELGKCPQCETGKLIERRSRFGKFIGCSNYPECRYIQDNKVAGIEDMACPKCKEGKVVAKRTKRGKVFYGCNKYPECQFASWDKPVKTPCPSCGGLMVEKAKKDYPVCQECGYEQKNPMP